MNVANALQQSASFYGSKPLLYFRDQPLSFFKFGLQTRKAKAILEGIGTAPGDRVAILAGNKPEWLACYFAILATGAIIVPINPALTPDEVAYIIDDSAPVLVFVDIDLANTLSPSVHKPKVVTLPSYDGRSADWDLFDGPLPAQLECVDVDGEAPSIIYYTSGTTGRPKGAVIPHRSTLSTMTGTSKWLHLSEKDVVVITGSFAFILHSTFAASSHMLVGATIIIRERFHPKDALDAIERYRATVLMWVPTMYIIASEYAEANGTDLSSLRVCVSGGAPLPWAVAERFHKVSGAHVLSGWGMSEGTPITGFDPSGPGRPESIGKELADCSVRVLDDAGQEVPSREVGELVYLSPRNMTGYLNRPADTAEILRNGWIHSGDLGWRDEDGFFYIAGRKKDMIIRGGAKIYPAEVEEVVTSSTDVAESAVIGLPDDRYGERIVAFVTPREGRVPTPESLRLHCEGSLAVYKIPQEFVVITEFPRGPTGKILKRILRDQFVTEPLNRDRVTTSST
jgi:long-chain acyl-CoA synthetase